MGSMIIRNIPDAILKRFKDRAKSDGKSAEQLARDVITGAAKPSRAQVIRQIDAIRARTKRSGDMDIVDEIRRDRERADAKSDQQDKNAVR